MPNEVEVRIYARPDGTEPYTDWEKGLRDRAARARVRARIGRLRHGNFGDAKRVERAEAYWRDYRSRDHGED